MSDRDSFPLNRHSDRVARRVKRGAVAVDPATTVLAIDQFALQLSGMNPNLVLASTPVAIANALADQQVAIWLPSAMVLALKL